MSGSIGVRDRAYPVVHLALNHGRLIWTDRVKEVAPGGVGPALVGVGRHNKWTGSHEGRYY